MSKPWYSEEAGFFGAEYLNSHADRLTQARTACEVKCLETRLGLERGISILDIPCGHGRHSIELARRGYSVVGQDLNEFFLEKAAADAREACVEVTFRKADMRDLPFVSRFDVVLNLFTAFGYFETEEEDQLFLSAVVKAMKSGGKFVMDFVNRDKVMRNWTSHNWHRLTSGLIVVNESSFDFLTSKVKSRSVHIYPDGRITEVENKQRLYTLRELVLMCERAGLEFREAFGDFDGSPISFESPRVILVAQK